jgi:DNA-binding GntR family transcriptional regulator
LKPRQALDFNSRSGNGSGALSKQIFRILSERIVALELTPHEQLSETNIASELGVSRTPVREAFVRLSELGLVDIYPQRGTLVAPMRLPDLEKSQFMREALEIALLRRAMSSPDVGQLIGKLRAEIVVQKTFAELGEMDRFYDADEDFHGHIATFAGMRSILAEIERAKIHMNRARHLMITGIEDVHVVIHQHEALVDAMAKGDLPAAEDAMQMHLRRVLKIVNQAIEKFPAYFDEQLTPQRRMRS